MITTQLDRLDIITTQLDRLDIITTQLDRLDMITTQLLVDRLDMITFMQRSCKKLYRKLFRNYFVELQIIF